MRIEINKNGIVIEYDENPIIRKVGRPKKNQKPKVKERNFNTMEKMRKLISNGFFRKERTVREVYNKFKGMGYKGKITGVSPLFNDLLMKDELKRRKHLGVFVYKSK